MAGLKMETPRRFDGAVADAFESASTACEPIFVPFAYFTDDRGWSIMNQLQGVMGPSGQVNYSVQYPGVVKAWHRHQMQADFWLCLHGHVRVGVYREADKRAWSAVIGEKRPGVVVIPPPLWHGAATVGDQWAGLLYYVTRSYDPADPDEQRQPFDGVEGFDWQVQHR